MSAQQTDTPPRNRFASGLDRYFSITSRGSTIPREIRGGLVSFVTMAYIVILNPLILGGFSADQAAKDVTGGWLENAQVAAATGLVAGLMTIAMGVVANLPFGIAAGLGINSFLAVSVVKQVTWAEAMGLVVINGVIIVILALTGIRTMIFTAVPAQLKAAITVGIGLFIAFIGLVDSGFVRSSGLASPPLQLGEDGSVGALPTIVFLIGLVIIGTLMARRVKGALLIGIVATTIIAIILQAIFQVPTSVESKTGWNLNAPGLPSALFAVPDLSLVGHFDFGAFSRIGPLAASMLVFTLVFTNFFDAMGTMTGLAKAAGVAHPDGTFPRLKSALVVEGVGAIAGGGASVSSNTVFIDSAAGIGEGARTGMASVVTGVLFLASMFLTPLTQVVPLEVAAAGLVVVGALMVAQVADISWTDFGSALPAFLTIVVMPLTYSIANGIGAGFISWVLIKLLSGRGREVSWLLYVVAFGFLLYFARGPLEALLGVG
ncbi:NCS2 family permease [Curtobacterium sp. SP.BCp]|uniref:NCS2 family permease n=1 Tax=unclassified Curtobacterium TaxID=257496 RepID=UPI0025B4152A|nr:NCS2 family permease [Curtobacterium sp. 458]WJY01197.1 NCS2 family permease [Curtobacterium sp. 458]